MQFALQKKLNLTFLSIMLAKLGTHQLWRAWTKTTPLLCYGNNSVILKYSRMFRLRNQRTLYLSSFRSNMDVRSSALQREKGSHYPAALIGRSITKQCKNFTRTERVPVFYLPHEEFLFCVVIVDKKTQIVLKSKTENLRKRGNTPSLSRQKQTQAAGSSPFCA